MRKSIFIILCLVLSSFTTYAECGDSIVIKDTVYSNQDIVDITDFGGVPDSESNVMPAVQKALAFCTEHTKKVLFFPKGRYDFWPTDFNGKVCRIPFDITGFSDFTIDGGGSQFIFHDKMGVVCADSCQNLTLRNFTVDWDRPWISQAEIINTTPTFIDMKIDRSKYPYIIIDKRIRFIIEGHTVPILNVYNNVYDKVTKDICYRTWDSPLLNFFEYDAEELSDGLVRFHCPSPIPVETGTFITLFHEHYGMTGIQVKYCKNVIFQDIKLFHTLGNGFWAYRTENVTMKNASCRVNENKDRVFSTVADASHFSSCKGTILVENCEHTGQGDDFINVHGRHVKITEVLAPNTIKIQSHLQEVLPNEDFWIISHETAKRGEVVRIKSLEKIEYPDPYEYCYIASLSEDIRTSVQPGDCLENIEWNPSVIIRDCRILKRHRARGILVTTPKDVLIEHNYFNTAGASILIEGDLDFWFESGANRNVVIRENVFDNCLTSGNADGKRQQWGEAIITITPSHRPQNTKTVPYHKNITIQDNIFKVFDAPIVRARSVGNMSFKNNRIIKSHDYKPYTWQKSAFLLDGCRDVKIFGNQFDPEYSTRSILIEHMKKNDVKVDRSQNMKIDYYYGDNTYQTWF